MIGSKTQNIGDYGEKIAIWWLQKKGYKIIKTHHTSRFGEIDIIAKEIDQFVFVEVKFRMWTNSGLPEQFVNFEKKKRMKKTILAYISQNFIENFRVDIISIMRGTSKNKLIIRHHKAVLGIFDIR